LSARLALPVAGLMTPLTEFGSRQVLSAVTTRGRF
jgi:hypothetical protein